MYEVRYGENYNAELSNKDIAKTIKKELKERYKGLKISARSDLDNIRIKISLPKEKYQAKSLKDITERTYIRVLFGADVDKETPEEYFEAREYLNKEGEKIQEEAKELLKSYNSDGSEPMLDYFSMKFCGSVKAELI